MKIHFASFFDKKNWHGEPVSIARSKPKFLSVPTLTCLQPPKSLLKLYKSGKVNDATYTHIYENEVLRIFFKDVRLNPHNIFMGIKKLVGNVQEVTLLCWEKEGEFCHRRIVHYWLNTMLNTIREWCPKHNCKKCKVISVGELH